MNEYGNMDLGGLGMGGPALGGDQALENGFFDFLKKDPNKVPLTDEQKAIRRQKAAQTAQDITGIAGGLLSTFGPKQQQQPTYAPPPQAGTPWGWIIGGVAVVGLAGIGLYLATRD